MVQTNLFTSEDMSAQFLKDKVLNDNGLLVANDIVYCSSDVESDFKLIKDKTLEFYHQKNISIFVSAYLNGANVLIVDKQTILSDRYDPEIGHAISHNQRIIMFSKFSEMIHSNLVVIDQKMYQNILKMIKSSDRDTLHLACEVMSSANRTDPESLDNIMRLCTEFEVSLFSGISKYQIKQESPHIAELFNFLENEHYEQYQRFKTGS